MSDVLREALDRCAKKLREYLPHCGRQDMTNRDRDLVDWVEKEIPALLASTPKPVEPGVEDAERNAAVAKQAGELNDALGVLDLCQIEPLIRDLEAQLDVAKAEAEGLRGIIRRALEHHETTGDCRLGGVPYNGCWCVEARALLRAEKPETHEFGKLLGKVVGISICPTCVHKGDSGYAALKGEATGCSSYQPAPKPERI